MAKQTENSLLQQLQEMLWRKFQSKSWRQTQFLHIYDNNSVG